MKSELHVFIKQYKFFIGFTDPEGLCISFYTSKHNKQIEFSKNPEKQIRMIWKGSIIGEYKLDRHS